MSRVWIRIHQLLPHSFNNRELRECCPESGPIFAPEVLWHWEGRWGQAQMALWPGRAPCGGQGSLCPVLFQLLCVAATVAEPARARRAAAGLLRLGSDHRGRFSKAWLVLLALSSALVPPHVTAVFSPFSRDLACPCSEVWRRPFTNLELYCLELEAYILW